MRKNRPGYPLPSGTLGNDEIVCQLVYLPNRPEYWQALLGAISYMGTWVAWEADAGKRGKDAAANWREAFELTIGCWRMTCLEEIKALLVQLIAAQCCESNLFTQLPSPLAPNTGTEIEDWEGTEPDYYGDQSIDDWDDWAEYKCEAAYYFVELVAQKFDDLDDLFNDYDADVVSIEMLGWVVSKLGTLGFISLAWDVFTAIRDWAWETIGGFGGAAAEIRAAADDIACAISNGDGAQDAASRFEAACKDAVTGTVPDTLLGGMPWEAWANIIYTGIGEDHEGTTVYLTDVLDAPGTNACCGPTKLVVFEGENFSGYSTFTLTSELRSGSPDYERLSVGFREPDGTTPKLVKLLSLSHVPTPHMDFSTGTYVLYNHGGNFYNSDTFPTLPVNITALTLVDQRTSGAPTEFEITVTWEEI